MVVGAEGVVADGDAEPPDRNEGDGDQPCKSDAAD